ncbi:hypothetical protein D3C86_2071140 [compost metagenome]
MQYPEGIGNQFYGIVPDQGFYFLLYLKHRIQHRLLYSPDGFQVDQNQQPVVQVWDAAMGFLFEQ